MISLFFACILSSAAQAGRPSTNQLMAEARSAQQQGNLSTAARDFRMVADMHPKDAEAHIGLGAVLTQQARYDDAVSELKSALPLTGTKHKPEVLTAIGLAYLKKGDLEAARTPLEEALALQRSNAPAARLLAEIDLKQNDAAAALAVLIPVAGAASLDPEFGRVFGLALVRSGKLFDGAQALEHSAQATGVAEIFKLAGVAYLDSQEFDSARRDLETARQINPALPEIDGLVAIARERCGDHFAAESIFRNKLQAEPEDFSANLYLGAILLKRHDVQGATPYLSHALGARPADPLALYESAMLQMANQSGNEAAESLKAASAADPTWAEPHLQLAILYDNHQQVSAAASERALANSLTAAQQHSGTIPPHLP